MHFIYTNKKCKKHSLYIQYAEITQSGNKLEYNSSTRSFNKHLLYADSMVGNDFGLIRM